MASLADISIRFSTNLKQFSSQMQNASRQMRAVGKQMQSTGRTLTAGLTLPLVAAAAAATKLALDFDDNMTKIQTLVGLSSEKVRELRKEVLKLAGDTSKAPEELSRALFTVTSAGIRGAEAMDILSASAKASSVGLGDTTEVARTTTAVLQAYGKENITAARAADILTATVREGNLEASELAPVLGRVIGLASQLGISFEEVGASIATFTRLGVDSAEAVTGLRGVMNALIKPTAAGRDALASVGLSFEKLRQSVKEKGLAQSLVGLVQAFKGNDEALSAIIPNVRALSAVLGTAGSQSKEYQRIVKSLTSSQGILDDAFEKTSKTAGFTLRKAFTDLKVVATELGSIILPVVADLAKRLSSLTNAFKGLDPAQQKTIVATLAFAATLGPATLLVGTMITSIGKMASTMRALSVAMAATPWGLVAAGVGVLAVAFGGLLSVRKKLNQNDVSAKLKKEKAEINSLIEAATNENNTKESRLKILNEIESKYPSFLGNLDKEKVANSELLEQLKAVNSEYETKIIQQVAEEKTSKLLRSKISLQERERDIIKAIAEEQVKLDNNEGGSFTKGGTYISGADNARKAIAELTNALSGNREQQESLNTEYQEQLDFYNSLIPKAKEYASVTSTSDDDVIPKKVKVKPVFDGKSFDLNEQINDVLGNAAGLDSLFDVNLTPALSDLEALRIQIMETLSVMGVNHPLHGQVLEAWDNVDSQIKKVGDESIPEFVPKLTILQEAMSNAFIGLGNVLGNTFSSMLDGAKVTVGGIIKELAKMVIKLGIAAAAAAALRAILGDGSAAKDGAKSAKAIVSVLSGLASGFGSGLGSSFGGSRSSGGPVTAGMTYLTSEHMKGEYFVPNQNGRIYTSNDIQNRSGGLNSTIRIIGEFIQRGPDMVAAIDQTNRQTARYSG